MTTKPTKISDVSQKQQYLECQRDGESWFESESESERGKKKSEREREGETEVEIWIEKKAAKKQVNIIIFKNKMRVKVRQFIGYAKIRREKKNLNSTESEAAEQISLWVRKTKE